MKKIFKYLLLTLIVLVPFGVKAINTKSLNFGEVKEGYYCYLLGTTSDARYYDIYYSYRKFGALSKNSEASDKPSPRCLDDTINSKKDFLAGNNCFFDLYSTQQAIINNNRINYVYSGWSKTVTDTNRYYSNLKDCIAAGIVSNGVASADTHSQNSSILYMEVKKNSEVYNSDEMNKMKEISPNFNDDTQICYATKGYYAHFHDAPIKIFFGHPQYVVDFRGVIDDMANDDDPYNALVSKRDSYNNKIIDFSNIKSAWNDSKRGDSIEGKIGIDVIPRADDTRITFKEFNKLADNQNGVYILVDENGNVITDSKTCTGLAAQAGESDKVVDTTTEDEDRKITSKDFSDYLTGGMTKRQAIKTCYYGDSDDKEYHCYRYTFLPIGHPMYNTTVWTKKKLQCGFELVDWDWTQCKKSALDITYKQCKTKVTKDKEGKDVSTEYCKNITNSGYNGVPDFYDDRELTDKDIECNNLHAFHIIYRAITIFAPIMTILFVTFDLIASIVSGDPKKVAKFRTKLTRRIIALVLLFVTPVLIHFLVSMLKNDAIKNTKYLKCVVLGNGTDKTTKTDNKTTKSTGTTIPTTAKVIPVTGSDLIKGIIVDGETVGDYTGAIEAKNSTIESEPDDELDDDNDSEIVEEEDDSDDDEDNDADNELDEEEDDSDDEDEDDVASKGFFSKLLASILGTTDDEELDDEVASADSNYIESKTNPKEIEITKPSDTESVVVGVITASNDVKVLSGDGLQMLYTDNDTINIVATENYKSYDTVSLSVSRKNSAIKNWDGDWDSLNQLADPPKVVRKKIKNSAKKVKKVQKSKKMKWCSKRIKCLKKDKKGTCIKKKVTNPACATKKVENLITSNNKQNMLSCASIVSSASYQSGTYSSREINKHNVNGAASMTKFLIKKKWKVIKKWNDIQPGDVMVFKGHKSNPTKVDVPTLGKKAVGHLEIAAKVGKKKKGKKKTIKSYNSGGSKAYKTGKAKKCTRKDFSFALRFNGY